MFDEVRFEDLRFHDASLESISFENSSVLMCIEHARYRPFLDKDGEHPLVALMLSIKGVERISEDNRDVTSLTMKGDHATILDFDLESEGVLLNLLWWQGGGNEVFSSLRFFGQDISIMSGSCKFMTLK